MPSGLTTSLAIILLVLSFFSPVAHCKPTLSLIQWRESNPLDIDRTSAPSPENGPRFSARALRDTSLLPAQIGGIVGAYGVSLVLVAITLLSLAKKRREHLEANEQIEIVFNAIDDREEDLVIPTFQDYPFPIQTDIPNFSLPSPTNTAFKNGHGSYVQHSPISPISSAPGIDPLVDQSIVAADKAMAQQQLEEMYKYVMEQEDAKQKGIVLDAPVMPGATQARNSSSEKSTTSKKGKTKPSSLNLSATKEDKHQSLTSSLLSVLRSPRKKSVRGVSISSPIMTPMSGTFPRHESQEMNSIPPRHYAPPPPPPIPANQVPYTVASARSSGAPLTPDISPESVQSIDERIGAQLDWANQSRHTLQPPHETDPESATSEHSQVPLIGLPSSPKPGSRFPSLPSSPKPGSTFRRSNAPSAVRTGGTLPLRAYEPAMGSPSVASHVTKQTVFERKGPLSPSGGRTPYTASAVPYSPYQPFTPCMPVTPSLVTKEDRKRMKKMVPKTPTFQMVQSSEDVW